MRKTEYGTDLSIEQLRKLFKADEYDYTDEELIFNGKVFEEISRYLL